MPLTVEIVTAERIVRTEKGVDVLVAPGSAGVPGGLADGYAHRRPGLEWSLA